MDKNEKTIALKKITTILITREISETQKYD